MLGYKAARTYQAEPPIPARTVSASGAQLFSGEDVRSGQEVFLRNGLMQYGSIFGHGAYLGPDFTADYLHRAALDVENTYGGEGTDARQRSIADFRTNTYDPATGTVTYSDAQAAAYQRLVAYYHEFFSNPAGDTGLRPAAIASREDTRQLTAYFSWSAWVAAAERPGKDLFPGRPPGGSGWPALRRSRATSARPRSSMEFLTNDLNSLLEWLRLPGDALFIGGGVLPLLWMGIQGVRYRGSHQDALTDDDLLLFTEVVPLAPPPPDPELVGAP